MGTPILIAVSVVALMLGIWHHAVFFSSEYRLSTWQLGLSNYAPWIILFLGLLMIIGSIQWVFSKNNSAATPIEKLSSSLTSSFNVMPSANSATNPVTALLNTGIRNTKNSSFMPSLNFGTQKKSPMIPGLNFSSSQV
jgi:hypothetical protein